MTKCSKCGTEFDHGICPNCGFTEGGVYVSNPKKVINEKKQAEKKLEDMRKQEEKAREQRLKQIKARERDRKGEIQNLQEKDEREYKREKESLSKEAKKIWEGQEELDQERRRIRRESRREQWKNRKKAVKRLAIGAGATAAAGGAASKRQQPPPPPPAYKKQSPLVKYLGIIVIVGALGLVVYFHQDEVSSIWYGFSSSIGGMLPGDFDLFIKCITFQVDDMSVCWGGKPPEPIVKHQVIDISFENGRGPKAPITGEPYSVLVEVKNLLEDTTIDGITIHGQLECEVEETDEGWGDIEGNENRDIELIPLEESYQLPPEGVRTLLKSYPLSCELVACNKLNVTVVYQYNNTLETQFRFGETREKAKFARKDSVGQGPISLEASFGPYGNYYYPNEGYGSPSYITNKLDLTITAVNKGYGEGKLLDYSLEKKYDDFNFLSEVEPCEFTQLGVELEKDDYENCYPIYSFSESSIESNLKNYQSVFFEFNVDYEYTRTFKKSLGELKRGPTCPEEPEDGEGRRTGTTIPENGGDRTDLDCQNHVIKISEIPLGAPYSLGATHLRGDEMATSKTPFDCSGYTEWVYNRYGHETNKGDLISYGSPASSQVNIGKVIDHNPLIDHDNYKSIEPDISKFEPGDLLFFYKTTLESRITHVGIYYGNGRIIHAGQPECPSSLSGCVQKANLDTSYWKEHYIGARRIC